jgi:hypothetical protein
MLFLAKVAVNSLYFINHVWREEIPACIYKIVLLVQKYLKKK